MVYVLNPEYQAQLPAIVLKSELSPKHKDVSTMLDQCWINIDPTLGQCLVFDEDHYSISS